jgi:pilus assembly protein CpaE
MAVFLLNPGAVPRRQTALVAGLKVAMPDLIEATSLREILTSKAKSSRAEPLIAVVILPPGDRQEFEQLVTFAARHAHEIFLILIGDEISANDYKQVIRSGGADWVSANADPAEVLEIIARRRHSEAGPGSAEPLPPSARPVTISFVPSAGGVGNATLVLEIAAQLKTDKASQQRKICIVDLDFQTSHVCDYLDSEARLQVADLSSAPERLDEHLFESFRTHHSSGIDIFAAPRSKFPWETLNVNALDALFTMIARRYNLVLIDYPVPWFSWTTQIIAASDAAIITGINTIPCLRQVGETLELVRSSGSSSLQIAIAINRCDYTMLGTIARRKHVEMVLRKEQLFFIANRPEAIESVNMGQPMMLGASARKLRRDFLPLANFCAGLKSRSSVSA